MKQLILRMAGFLLLASLSFAQMPAAAPSSTAPSSTAPSPTEDEVLGLFKLMRIRQQTDAVMKASEGQTKATIRSLVQKKVPDITEAQFAELDGMIDSLYQRYPVDQLLGEMVPVYQKHLSKADVDAIAAFYSSPSGQKLLRETPAMTTEAMQIAMARMQTETEDILVQLDQRIQQMAEENKKKAARCAADPHAAGCDSAAR
ncbi:MAG TPA: DUF2059 domain-containing protein [Terriglobales bacterium]|nr:DUF2059 domain-containing protein [Terriglobales bacterium]